MDRLRRCDDPPPASWDPPLFRFRLDWLPPLPPILSSTHAVRALRHKSALSDLNHNDPLVREAADLNSNRRLEWEGDSLFAWLTSVELARQFPNATAGDLSTLRHRIVSNRTLSHLSWSYGFALVLEHNPHLPPNVLAVTHQKVLADTFEAYLGAASQPPLSPVKMDALLLYIRALLDPTCVIGLADAAHALRERRLGVSAARTGHRAREEAIKLTTSVDDEPARTSTGVDWEERRSGGRWIVSIRLSNQTVVTSEATKRYEAQQQAVNAILTRLGRNPTLVSALARSSTPDEANTEMQE